MSSTDASTRTTKDPTPEPGPAEAEAGFASELDVTTALGTASRPTDAETHPTESPEAGQPDSSIRKPGPTGQDPATPLSSARSSAARTAPAQAQPSSADRTTPAQAQPSATTQSTSAEAQPSATDRTSPAKARSADAASAADRGRWGRLERSALRALPRSTIAAILVVAVSLIVAAAAVFAWRTGDAADQLAALRAGLDTDAAAERAATDYALGVSEVDAGQVDAWREALTSGVTEQLAAKLTAAADVVGPWLTQMEYSATAKPLAAKVRSRDGDLYVVQVFVDMNSRSSQTPEGVVATAAYTVTLDRAADWTITDVGGVASDLPVPTPDTPPAPR